MSRPSIAAFEASHINDAGALLAERHVRHRKAAPLLAARYGSIDEATREVHSAFAVGDASGAIATRDGRVVGYLIGAPKAGASWGDSVWVEPAGHAVSEPETIRDLYAFAAAGWTARGNDAHYTLVPASDHGLIGAWFRLGFGHQHTHAIRPVPTGAFPVRDVVIRRAARADIPVLAELDRMLPQHQAGSPVFAAATVPTAEEARADWDADFDDPDFATFVAERDGQVIGSAVGCSVEKSSGHAGLARPDEAALLSFAAVRPEARGRGAGRALGEAVLHWAAQSGYRSIVTDWRETNLLSSRAWPALGFTPTFVRLHRRIAY